MKIGKLVVRSKRWTSCFLFRANTCKTGFELYVALLRVTFFLQRHWRRTVSLVLTRFWQENVIFLTNQKRPFYKHARGVGRHLEIKFAFEGYPAIYFAWGKLSFQDKMTGGFSGKKLFVGGLPPKVDEKALRDVFSRFWHIEEGLSVRSPRILEHTRDAIDHSWAFLNITVHWFIVVYA